MITLVGMVEMIGIWNDACHEPEPVPRHQLDILWQTMVSNPYKFDHQQMLEHFTQWSKVGNSESGFWDLKLRQMRVLVIELYFPVGNLWDHVQTPGYKHNKLRMQDFCLSLGQDLGKAKCWQYMPLIVAHHLLMMLMTITSLYDVK